MHSATALSQGLFGLVGKMMLHAIIHYAIGLPGVFKGVANHLLTDDVNEALPFFESRRCPRSRNEGYHKRGDILSVPNFLTFVA